MATEVTEPDSQGILFIEYPIVTDTARSNTNSPRYMSATLTGALTSAS